MKNILLILHVLFVFVAPIKAQNETRIYQKTNLSDNAITINTTEGNYIIKVYSDEIIETSFIPNNEIVNNESHAVDVEPINIHQRNFKEDTNSLEYNTGGIVVQVQKRPFKMSYYYKNNLLISEKNGYKKHPDYESLDFNLNKTEVLYGTGERVLGMNRRGNKVTLYNKAHYGYTDRSELMGFSAPIVISSQLYAVHFDNPQTGNIDLDSNHDNTLTYEVMGGNKTYQIIAAPNWPKLIKNYTYLTGKQPLPPRWTFGNFASRFGYHSQNEVEQVVDKFKTDNIPLDAIILDLYWFGKEVTGTMGNLAFDRDSFPKPKEMIENLTKKGVNTIVITEPFVLTTSNKWTEAVENKILGTDSIGNPLTYDFFFGNTGLVDIFKPQAKDWFWDIYKDLKSYGISGWWGDLGEPEVHPSEMYHHNKKKADEVHNIYGHTWAKLIHDGYIKDFPKERPFILMRSGYSGSQKYGMIPWSGDVGRSWASLKSQLEISLQMGMQGIAYMHSDLGGFAGNEVNDELYVRWLQYGVFQPIFRPHAQESVPSEVIFKEGETKRLTREAIELRSKLMPYNYTLAFENSKTGMPFMRPLFFEEPQNDTLLAISEIYLWGNDFLIAPITESGQQNKSVYFPKNNNWYNFYTGKKYNGGTNQIVNVSDENIPTFIRGGAFIPMLKQATEENKYSLENLDLHFYLDAETLTSSSQIYNDDGKTRENYNNENYEIIHVNSQLTNNILSINFNTEIGKKYISNNKKIKLIIHNIEASPKKILINGKTVNTHWNGNNNEIQLPTILEKDMSISIELK